MPSERVGRPLQESMLALMIYDDQHGGVVAKLLPPESFDGDYADIAREVSSYWASYNRAPKRQIDELFADIFTERTGRDVTYGDLFVHMLELHQSGINVDFLVDKVNKLQRFQNLKTLLIDSAERAQNVGEEALEDIDRAIDDYRKLKLDSSSKTLSLLDYDKILDQLQARSTEFDLGISELDRSYIGPARGRLFLLLGTSGLGKSWGLIQAARRALLRRKRVLYVTCEMSDYEVGSRFFQSLLGVSTRDVEAEITRLEFDDNGKFVGFDREKMRSDFALMNDNAHTELAVRIRRLEWMFRNLCVRQYPSGTLTPELLEAGIDTDASLTGFMPDMVVVDYVGIMKTDPKHLRETLGHNGIGLRRIAVERNVAMVTAQQATRGAMQEQKSGREVDIEHTAEDWSLIATSDVALTMSQTRAESALGLMRLFVGKGRSERGRFASLITQNYTHGQFAIDSHRIPSSYTKLLSDFIKDQDREQESDDPDDD